MLVAGTLQQLGGAAGGHFEQRLGELDAAGCQLGMHCFEECQAGVVGLAEGELRRPNDGCFAGELLAEHRARKLLAAASREEHELRWLL